jgi:hypothetical protein
LNTIPCQSHKSFSAPDSHTENERLALKYSPLLVLFPEIEPGSERKEHHHPGHCLGSIPPLDQDYHPRDVRLILDNARLPATGVFKYLRFLGIRRRKTSCEQLLSAMSENRIKYIDLIDEHSPKDVDKFWRVYADIPNKNNNPDYHRKAYARVIRGSGRFEKYISIQYWLAYFFNDFANVHEMDWEMISVILKVVSSTEKPIACAYNAHIASFRKPWATVEKVDDTKNMNPLGSHPVAYVANGSHASYFSDYPSSFNVAEEHLKPVLKNLIRLTNISAGLGFTDYVPGFEDERMVKCFPDIAVIPEPDQSGEWPGDWKWLNFEGNWGSQPELSLKQRLMIKIPVLGKLVNLFKRPIQEAGPTGPNMGHGSCWDKPFEWINMECLDTEENKDRNWLEGSH